MFESITTMMQNLLAGGLEPAPVTRNFLSLRPRYTKYYFYFGFREFLNLMTVVRSIFVTDALLPGKFLSYGQTAQVIPKFCCCEEDGGS